MTSSVTADQIMKALPQRLGVAARALGTGPIDESASPAEAADQLLRSLVVVVGSDPSPDRVWLLLVAITATFPTSDEVTELRRKMELERVDDLVRWLLHRAGGVVAAHASGAREMRLVADRAVVDVDFSSKDDLHTGIQRVVRHVAPRWDRTHDADLVVWTSSSGAFRGPNAVERARVLHWGGHQPESSAADDDSPIIVPWKTTVVLPEVARDGQAERLVGLAEHSGNRVVLVGYDCIPVIAADLVSDQDAARFTQYLTLVKHASALAAISESVGDEFRGFCRSLAVQGLRGPDVEVIQLGVDVPEATSSESTPPVPDEPEILMVGSWDLRKNQLAVLQAAEILWREGLRFRLRVIGNPGWASADVQRQRDRLVAAGRPIEAERGLDDDGLWQAYEDAWFTVFPSLQEGYGLPVVESLSHGVPVIASDYGSVAEIADGGGAVLVDPRDDDSLIAAMRRLLTKPEERARLAAEAAAREFRTWDDYAASLFAFATGETR